MRKQLIKQLVRHEALRLKPYRCTANKLTIGIGRNIEENGISEDEAFYLLNNDLDRCEDELSISFGWYDCLPEIAQSVLMNMCFNMGLPRLKKFKNTLRYFENHEWEKASVEMLDSKWADQVGVRAIELSNQLLEL